MNSKIADRTTFVTQTVPELRKQGLSIVFTNGCFDILHVGHVRYLQQTKALGDILVIGLNTDSSVAGLKGPERPLVNEAERAEVLAALECVDYVVMFSEPTPADLIADIVPDILAKGGDYKPEQIAGHKTVLASGGRVEIIPFVPGKSSSRLIQLLEKL